MKKKQTDVDVIMPKLVQGEKAWFVEYCCFCPRTNKLEKFRVYKGFKKLKTEKEKIHFGNEIIKVFSKQLLSGWRPWDHTVYLYRDEIQYKSVTNSFGNKKNNSSHLRKYLSDFLIETKRRVSKKSYETYQGKTRLFCQWLEENGYKDLRVFEIQNAVVKKYFNYLIDTRKLDKVTVDKYCQNINQLFKFFVKQKLIDKNPVFDIVLPPKRKDMAARPMADDDMKVFLNYVAIKDEQFLLACLMQFFLCCRPGNELRLLKIQDIDFYAGVVHITQEDGKTGTRKITMPSALIELCNNYKLSDYPRAYYVFSINGKPGMKELSRNFFYRKFIKYRNELGLPLIYKFYSFKHTGAGKLL